MLTDLRQALQTLIHENVDEIMVYHIRDREGKGWDGPRVVKFTEAFNIIAKFLDSHE